ncbi:MAG: hypothetical protein KGR98_05970 [Verrucomicrobia bacterium]|nr:hypothetical protein [Verrucomicrobiota bacterium]MDE3100385.1 hypothetical protein [Verrucomicrobiota bacterium]
MLLRISLIISIVAALGAGILDIVEVKGKINTLMSQRDQYHSQRDQVQASLNSTKRELSQTKDQLADAKQQLAGAQAAEKKAEATANSQLERANQLAAQLKTTQQQRDNADTHLAAYTATGLTPDQVTRLSNALRNSQTALDVAKQEESVMSRTVIRLQNQVQALLGKGTFVVRLRADLRGKVLAVDPKWDFVVLNIGGDQGVLPDGELLVSRDGRLVAKVIVRNVQKDRCIANVVPGWQLGDIYEGDIVTPAHPASS